MCNRCQRLSERSLAFPPTPRAAHERRQCSSQRCLSHCFPSGLKLGFFPKSCFGQSLEIHQCAAGPAGAEGSGGGTKERNRKEGRSLYPGFWESAPKEAGLYSKEKAGHTNSSPLPGQVLALLTTRGHRLPYLAFSK